MAWIEMIPEDAAYDAYSNRRVDGLGVELEKIHHAGNTGETPH